MAAPDAARSGGEDTAALVPQGAGGGVSLRCDVCGSRRARLIRFDSVLQALAFAAGRRIT